MNQSLRPRFATPSRILYLGDTSPGSTSQHRLNALARLGHEVTGIDHKRFLPNQGLLGRKFHRWTGHRYQQKQVIRNLREQLASFTASYKWDLVWVDSGAWCGKQVSRFLKDIALKLVVLNLDDPTGPREPYLWRSLVNASSEIDAFVVVRDETRKELEDLGARCAIRVWRCYDEVEHRLLIEKESAEAQFRSEVSFIGTRMENREEMLVELIQRGVPISLWGNGWRGGRYWSKIQPFYRGEGLHNQDYVSAIIYSKLNLCFLSKLNRDSHTTRSSEIPYAGGVLLAPRTDEHCSMFRDETDALLWNDLGECTRIVQSVIHDENRLKSLRRMGKERITSLGLGNEDMLDSVVGYLQTGCYVPHTSLLSNAGNLPHF